MIRPILAYGHSILRQNCTAIEKDYPELHKLIADMWETMNSANGCGLASPQIGLPIRLFVVDSKTTFENLDEEDRRIYFDKNDKGIKETFINAKIVSYSERKWDDEEGCLSIPGLSKKVTRPWEIIIEYYDRDFNYQIKTYSGATARMIQHEYDHTEGVLYLDYLKPLTKKMMGAKLKRVVNGQVKVNYPMKFLSF